MRLFAAVVAILACASAAPRRLFMPRLPVSVILSGRYQLIPEDKIVGGAVVEPNSIPFQISVQRLFGGSFSHSCGGSILDENTILDAAHCVRGVNVNSLRVVAGEHSLRNDSGLEQNRSVSRIVINAEYNPQTYENDIALLFLNSPLDLSVPSAKPVNLPPPTSEFDPPTGLLVTVSGWGTTSLSGSLSDTLRSVKVPIVSDADCNAAYSEENYAVYPSMLCAGALDTGGIDSCQGDSGGPLFLGTGADAVQHGIVSWGISCALADYPGVYTQVSYFLDWIAAKRASNVPFD